MPRAGQHSAQKHCAEKHCAQKHSAERSRPGGPCVKRLASAGSMTLRRYTPFLKPRKTKASPAFWKILAAAAGMRIEPTVCQPVAKANFSYTDLAKGPRHASR